MNPKAILLDTHAWIWILSGAMKLVSETLKSIEACKDGSQLFISDISLWEVSMLAKKERITLDQPVLAWMKNAIKISGIQLIRLTPEIVVESNSLPGDLHGDPADRLLVATARILDLTLVTRDEKILDYGTGKHIHTLKI
jgi:PIN domain nuclease of toxin-antitoxin system